MLIILFGGFAKKLLLINLLRNDFGYFYSNSRKLLPNVDIFTWRVLTKNIINQSIMLN